jgi:hypothetical protein
MPGAMRTINADLNVPQAAFLQLPHKFKAYVAGFGSGKTWVGCAGIAAHFWQWPGINQGYFAPTYPQIRDIFYPTVEEVAFGMGLRTKLKSADHEVEVYEGQKYRGTVICRSMEKPETIVGFKIGHALVDELDVMTRLKAQTAWRKIIARMRYNVPGLLNGIDVTTTPEGFKFVHQQFVKAVREKPSLASMYGLIQASTYDNELNLPEDYILALHESYPPQLIEAYLRGQFVNLTSGSVYATFDRRLNHTDAVIAEKEPLMVGMDFNVMNMTACINVVRDGLPMTLAERTRVRDTPEMARILKEEFKDKGHAIRIFPDASGQNTSSKNASESDLSILRQAGFQIEVNPSNPAVKDRVNAYNAMILNAQGERRFRINTDACPVTTEALEQQVWGLDGQPDKKSGHDHACFTADTVVQTRAGPYRFDAMPTTGEVIGPDGEWIGYLDAGKTGVKSTVKITIASGYVIECSQDHLFLVRSGKWIQAKDLMGHECMLSVTRAKSSMGGAITCAGNTSKTLPRKAKSACIGLFGPHATDRFQAAITSIMSMATAAITRLKTWFAYPAKSTTGNMVLSALMRSPKWAGPTSLVPRLGTDRMPGRSGTQSSIRGLLQRSGPHLRRPVPVAENGSKRAELLKIATPNTALRPAKPTPEGRAELTTLLASAESAASHSQQIGTAVGSLVMDVSPQGEREVYCLTVPDAGCFKLDVDSPIVSNCDANGYFIVKRWPIVKRNASIHTLNI